MVSGGCNHGCRFKGVTRRQKDVKGDLIHLHSSHLAPTVWGFTSRPHFESPSKPRIKRDLLITFLWATSDLNTLQH